LAIVKKGKEKEKLIRSQEMKNIIIGEYQMQMSQKLTHSQSTILNTNLSQTNDLGMSGFSI
jgi:hypothetical protein